MITKKRYKRWEALCINFKEKAKINALHWDICMTQTHDELENHLNGTNLSITPAMRDI